jgi:hypothetical protein
MYIQRSIWCVRVIFTQPGPDKSRPHLQQCNITGSNKTLLGLHVQCPILTEFVICPQIFMAVSNITFQVNPSSGSRIDTCGYTYGRTD